MNSWLHQKDLGGGQVATLGLGLIPNEPDLGPDLLLGEAKIGGIYALKSNILGENFQSSDAKIKTELAELAVAIVD